MSALSPWRVCVAEQRRSNERSWLQRDAFASHRVRQTGLLTDARAGGRLCVLGAGNCNDLELAELCGLYDEIHLADLDGAALDRAVSTLSPADRSRIKLHEGVDLCGLEKRLERWAALQVTPQELLAYPAAVAQELPDRIGAPFDRVASTCLLSQLHLSVRRVLGAEHPLFGAVSYCINLAHLRLLVALLSPGGRAVLTTDVASDEIAPLYDEAAKGEPIERFHDLVRAGQLFQAVHPQVLAAIAQDDPELSSAARLSEPVAAWFWDNGPTRRFLVVALDLEETRSTGR